MPGTFNQIHLIGRVGQDPEIRQTANGVTMASFTMATDSYSQQPGEDNRPDWHRVKAFGQNADTIRDHLARGHLVHITGRLEYNRFTDREGAQRTIAQIVAREVTLLPQGNTSTPPAWQDTQPPHEEEGAPVSETFDGVPDLPI